MRFGGVIPEIASRAHLMLGDPRALKAALAEADIPRSGGRYRRHCWPWSGGRTQRGVLAVKALAIATGVSHGINHLSPLARLLEDNGRRRLRPAGDADPVACATSSGGHTEIPQVRDIIRCVCSARLSTMLQARPTTRSPDCSA